MISVYSHYIFLNLLVLGSSLGVGLIFTTGIHFGGGGREGGCSGSEDVFGK